MFLEFLRINIRLQLLSRYANPVYVRALCLSAIAQGLYSFLQPTISIKFHRCHRGRGAKCRWVTLKSATFDNKYQLSLIDPRDKIVL